MKEADKRVLIALPILLTGSILAFYTFILLRSEDFTTRVILLGLLAFAIVVFGGYLIDKSGKEIPMFQAETNRDLFNKIGGFGFFVGFFTGIISGVATGLLLYGFIYFLERKKLKK